MILEKLYNIIFGEGCVEIGNTSKIFKKKPGLFCDNYFPGKYFLSRKRKVYVMLSTVRHDCLPKVVPEKYMHRKGTEPRNLVAKRSRLNETIIML